MNLSSKNKKLWLKIRRFKFTPKNQKQNCFQSKNRLQIKIIDSWNNEIVREWGKKDVDEDKDGENVPKLDSVEVGLVHFNLVNNNYQHTSKVMITFVRNKQFRQLINISPHYLTMMNTIKTEFSFEEVWFTGQVSKALEIEDNVNLTLIIG